MDRHSSLLLALVCGVPLLASCELFGLDDSTIEIDIPEYVIGPLTLPRDGLPAGTLPEGQSLARWVGTPPSPVDLVAAEPRLEKYTDTLDRIEIRKITYQVTENTLSADLQPLEIYFGPTDVPASLEDPAKDARLVKYGQTAVIAKGVTHPTAQTMTPGAGAVEQVAEIMSDLAFSSLAGAHVVVQGGQAVPSGQMKIKVGLSLTVFVKPY